MSSDEKKPVESKWTFVVGTSPTRTLFFAIALLSTVLYAVNSVTGTVPALQHDVLFASEPRLDASSMEALDRSLKEMSNDLPGSEREEFSQIVQFLIIRNYHVSMGTPGPDYPAVQLQPWHGYTARRLVAANRDDYAASIKDAHARQTQEAQEAKEYQAARVKEGYEEVRRLKAEIAREPEIRSLLSKVVIRPLNEEWTSFTIRKSQAEGGGEFSGYQLDLDFVVHNNTDVKIETAIIELDLVDRRDGSIIENERKRLYFGPPVHPFTYEILGDADPLLPGTSRRLRWEALFEVDDLPLGTHVDAGYLKSITRIDARATAIEDVQGGRAVGLWQISEARKHLEAWETFLADE
ncbi:hypothetical protein [Parvibaculum sp.]|uniref:hypothetical protein n=1 Tax=Parvibaculum sp. TaxID=2024848 RepID=UPI00391D881B